MVYGWKWVPFTDAICRRWDTNYDNENGIYHTYGEWHIGIEYDWHYSGPNEDRIEIAKCQEYAECKIDFGIDERITQSCEPFPGLDDSYGCKR